MTRFDRAQLVAFLRAIDRHLADDVALVIVDGAAMVLGYEADAMTSDVDVINYSGSKEGLGRAVELARQDTGLAVGVGSATVFTPPDGFEERLRRARGLSMQRLLIIVPEKYDLALSKIAASERRGVHDLEGVKLLHKKHPLSRKTLIERFEREMRNVSVADPRKLALTMAIAVSVLYGYEAGKKLAQKYGVPVPRADR